MLLIVSFSCVLYDRSVVAIHGSHFLFRKCPGDVPFLLSPLLEELLYNESNCNRTSDFFRHNLMTTCPLVKDSSNVNFLFYLHKFIIRLKYMLVSVSNM